MPRMLPTNPPLLANRAISGIAHIPRRQEILYWIALDQSSERPAKIS
jgi:hypothetical protein